MSKSISTFTVKANSYTPNTSYKILENTREIMKIEFSIFCTIMLSTTLSFKNTNIEKLAGLKRLASFLSIYEATLNIDSDGRDILGFMRCF